MYAVIGATGHTGRVVTEELLQAGQKVRAIARNADHLKELTAKGAEAFAASVDDDAAMTRAFQGVKGVYTIIPPNYAVPGGFRAYQNEVGNVIATAIERAGVKHLVMLSSVGAQHSDHTGPVKGLHDVELRLSALSDVNVLFLRAAYFMENTLSTIPMIKQTGMNGGPIKPDLSMPMIASRDVGVYAAQRLRALDFTGKVVQELLGARDYTQSEVTRIIGEAVGNLHLNYVQFSYPDAVNGLVGMGLPRQVAELLVEMTRGINEGLLAPTQPRTAKNTTPTTYEQFVEETIAPALLQH